MSDCGCYVDKTWNGVGEEIDTIIYCPTHAAAFEMRDALEKISDGACHTSYGCGCDGGCESVAHAALAKTESLSSCGRAWKNDYEKVSGEIKAVIDQNREMREVLEGIIDNGPCSDPDCCDAAIANHAAREKASRLLAGMGEKGKTDD